MRLKQVGKKDYVVGIEPGTNPPDGRAKIRSRGELIELEPYEKREFDLKITLKWKKAVFFI